jgi:hypothetical protein
MRTIVQKVSQYILLKLFPRLHALQGVSSQDVVWIRAVKNVDVIPFNGDVRRIKIIEQLIEDCRFDVGIETGTWIGNTTQWLAKHLPKLVSIEYDKGVHGVAMLRMGHLTHLELLHGRSEELFPAQVKLCAGMRVFCYLDAHAKDKSPPLGKELQAAVQHGNVLVVIDDFRVPNTEFGYGTYGDLDLDLQYLRSHIGDEIEIWGDLATRATKQLERGEGGLFLR